MTGRPFPSPTCLAIRLLCEIVGSVLIILSMAVTGWLESKLLAKDCERC